MSSQLQVSGEAKIRAIQGPVVANSGVITALDGGASQYVRGDGTLADFPTSTGGGSSVSYYLNSSVSQGTIGGVAYRQLGKTPISGAGTDIAISTTGYVASYLTDANDPALLEVPAGNFNCEFYFSVNNNTGNPFVYAEVYKYDGTTFTLLGTSVGVPEYITEGTVINPYYFAVPVATSVLTVTDRIAIRIYVNVDGRTVTLHTENNHLCQVVTTFSKGLISLNNLTRQNQFFGTGTSGTDFAISSSTATHTFNLPVASATNTGKLSSTDWSTFNGKQPAGNYVTLDTTQTITAAKTFSLDILVNGLTIGRGAGSIATNTAIGSSSLPVNTTGTLNTAIGNFSLLSNTTGYGNTSVGHTALGYNTTGFFNAAIGVNTLLSNTTGTYNNALGTAALYNNTTGSYNTAIGQVAGTNNTTGSNNTYIGNGSGGGITTGSNNTIIGAFNGTAALANNIVLADGAGNVRYQWDGTNNVFGNPISGTSASFSSSLTASSLIKSGGTSSQFLKADGSVDSNTYLTTSAASSTYLPLAGGTLTGALSGTSATFSGTVEAPLFFANAGGSLFLQSASDAISIRQNSTSNNLTIRFNRIGVDLWKIQTVPNGANEDFKIFNSQNSTNSLTIASTGAATFSSSLTIGAATALNFGARGGITQDGSWNFSWSTNSVANAFYLQSSTGNVGIGTNTFSFVAAGRRNLAINGDTDALLELQNAGSISSYLFSNSTNFEINAVGSRFMQFVTNSAERMMITSAGNTQPGTDNAYSLGVSGTRWSAVWAANGTIQTSDEREKKDIIESDLGLDFVSKLRPVSFKWKIGKNEVTTQIVKDEEGNPILDDEGNEKTESVITPIEGKRTHYGLIAQEVEELLDGKDFGGFIHDDKTDIKGLRYDQFVPLLIKSIQELQAKIVTLESKIN